MTTTAERTTEQKITSATHDFIRARLPDWLSRASLAQIRDLRARFKEHRASQARLRAVTAQLQSLQVFAERHFSGLLRQPLPEGTTFAELEWRVVTPRFDTLAGQALPSYGYSESRRNGLQQLMSNFPAHSTYYKGTGLVLAGTDAVLSGESGELVAGCRELDAGSRYQDLLAQVFSPATEELLADHKRSGLRLATKIAVLQGEIDAFGESALRGVLDEEIGLLHIGLRAYPGLLQVLEQPVADGMLIELKDQHGQSQGIVLYLPTDPVKALRYFRDAAVLEQALAMLLQAPAYRQHFSQLISLRHRAGFLRTLELRLQDQVPDLRVQARTVQGSVFARMAAEQVLRVKDDARLLLVPTAQADAQAARERFEQWTSAGMSLVNLAGLFIPVVGAILLGQLLVQTLSDIYEGVADLSEGHQHEALEHLFNVLETVAVGSAVVAGVALLQGGLLDTLQPVSLGARGQRLWSGDLDPYQYRPEGASLGADGLYRQGTQRWMRSGTRYFEVHRQEPNGFYRLRHPLSADAYGPIVLHNGERCWQLMCEQPLDWQDSARMLDTLWPQHPAIDSARARQILQVAGVDQDELRGILVENRVVPVNLRETLRRFEQDSRVDRFFAHVRSGQLPQGDIPLLRWCEAQEQVGSGMSNVLAHEHALRGPLLEHLTAWPASDDELVRVLVRDFPGLPVAYARELAAEADATQRSQSLATGRLHLELASRAAALLRVVRLSRALEGLYLTCAYSDETGALVMALLAQGDPISVSLELREGTVNGRLIGSIVAADDAVACKVMVRSQGRFLVYGSDGRPLALAHDRSADIFSVICETLTARQLAELGVDSGDRAVQLRAQIVGQVPATGDGISRLLGWPAQPRWFNPGRRLEDGRVGYLLSGREPGRGSAREVLRRGLQRYFPGLQDAQLDAEIERLLRGRGTAYQILADLQDDHEALDQALNRWVSAALSDAVRRSRMRVAADLRRAWRAQGELVRDAQGAVIGQRLHLLGPRISSLPELPATLEFAHLTVLAINETAITHVPAQFMQGLIALRVLNMNNNRLLRLPEGIGYLSALRELHLRHNDIRPDLASLTRLQSLGRLTHLDLSHNPLGETTMSFSRLPHLVQLRLQNCRLEQWPRDIGLCGFLEQVDLRSNQLVGVPGEVLAMPYEFRRSLLVDGNRLSSLDLLRLQALDAIVEENELLSSPVDDPVLVRAWWVDGDAAAQPARDRRWQRLQATAEGGELIGLLQRLIPLADYAWPRAELLENAWLLLMAIDTDADLQATVYRLAAQRPVNDNAVMDCFSQMWVSRLRNQVAQAQVATSGAELYALGRSLFRLEQVQRIARQDTARRSLQREVHDAPGIRLGYRVGLRQWLRLPGQPHALRITDLNRVSADQLLAARRTVRALETPGALASYLSQRPFWQGFLSRRYRPAFEALEQRVNERQQVLQARRGTLDTAQFQDEQGVLDEQRAEETQALRVELSLQFIRGWERGLG